MPSFSEFYCDDYFKIKYNNDIDIFISELSLSIRTGKSKMQVFKGILMTLPFGQLQNEYFELLIVNNGQIRLGEKRVYLEDPEFEKYFDVYSNDQIEARNIITPAFMTRLLKLQNKKLYNKIKISIEKGNINIAFPSDEDWFEIPLFKNPEKISNFRNIIMELISIISIVDSLKLIK